MSKPKFDAKNRLPMLYARSARGQITTWLCWVEGSTVNVLWGKQGGVQQAAAFECKPKNTGRANATTAEQQAKLEAVSKWEKQLKKKYYVKLEDAQTVTRIKPMLAQDYFGREDKVTWPQYVQPKLDGLRCLAYVKDDKVVLQSRGGETFTLPHVEKHLQDWLPEVEGLVLDGELYCHGMSLQNIVSAVRVWDPDNSPRIKYVAYDGFDPAEIDVFFADRVRWLKDVGLAVFEKHDDGQQDVFRLETLVARNAQEALSFLNAYVVDGFEGAMLRDPNSTYRTGYRSPGLLKMKKFNEKEYKIVGVERGRGKMKDCPIFVCKMPKSSETFNVVPVGEQKVREEMLRNSDKHIGKYMTVRHWGLTDAGKPKFPQGVLIRSKKAI